MKAGKEASPGEGTGEQAQQPGAVFNGAVFRK
jgi:hypothetical protein